MATERVLFGWIIVFVKMRVGGEWPVWERILRLTREFMTIARRFNNGKFV